MVAASDALLHRSSSEPGFGPLAVCEAKLAELFRTLEILFGPPTSPEMSADGAEPAAANEDEPE